MEIIRLENSKDPIFDDLCRWNYDWWGIPDGRSYAEVRSHMAHSCNTHRLPQTFVALLDGEPVGMYQLSMSDDLRGRPDIYPWLINVYVAKEYRGKQICRALMLTVRENARKAGLQELYLYTHHVGLYEKFGWEFAEEVPTFKPESPFERLYRMEIGG